MSYKFDAMVSILNWMESGQSVTPRFIREHLAISERTAFRYLQTLEGAGFPIHFDKNQGRYRFIEGYTLRRPNLTVSETLALSLAKMSLKRSGVGLEDEIENIENKLTTTHSGLPKHIIFADDDLTSDLRELFMALNKAISGQWQVEFTYCAASTGADTKRTVDPHYLYFGDGTWSMRGWCHSRREMRTFALDRINGLRTLGKTFVPQPTSPDAELDGAFGHFVDGEPVEVTLIFEQSCLPFLLRRKWHKSQRIRQLADGCLEMSFSVNGILGIRPWIYRWLPNVRVVAPLELVDLVQQELQTAMKMQEKKPL